MDYTYPQIAKMIDHSLLVPTLTDRDMEEGCRLALRYDVASVCVKPYFVRRCAEILSGSTVVAGTVIGFPHGSQAAAVKVAEAQAALADGAGELDMVVNIGKVLSGDWDYVSEEIEGVIAAAHRVGAKVKVIFENCYLSEGQKVRLCEICGHLRADWVKTSTGFGSGGSTLEDLLLMRRHCPPHVQVKAAGGIRSLDALLEARASGATRVGATRTADILDECKRRLGLLQPA